MSIFILLLVLQACLVDYPSFIQSGYPTELSLDVKKQFYGIVNNVGITSTKDSGRSWVFYSLDTPVEKDSSLMAIKSLVPGFLLATCTKTGMKHNIYRSSSPYGPWTKVYTFERGKPRANRLNVDMCFIDNLLGYAMTCYDIAKTIDGGKTWTQVYHTDSDAYYTNIQFLSAELGWFIDYTIGYSDRDTLFSTTNGGNTWQKKTLPDQGRLYWFNNRFDGVFIALRGKVYKTVDGGFSWEQISSIPIKDSHILTNACVRDTNEAWFVQYNDSTKLVYHTRDGGYNWEATGVLKGFPFRIYDLQDSLIASDQVNSFISKDGVSWELIRSSLPIYIAPVVKVWNDTLLISNSQNTATKSYFLSRDNAYSWVEKSLPGSFRWLDSFAGLGNHIWLGMMEFPNPIGVLYSSDYGNSWNETILPINHGYVNDISFINESMGILSVCTSQDSVYSHLFYTSDGGRVWTETDRPKGLPSPYSLFFFPNGTDYVLDSDFKRSAIGKSTDFGHTWYLLSSPDQGMSKFDAMYAISPDTLIFAYNYLWKSFDGGKSWTKVNSESRGYYAILFRNSVEGTAIYRKDNSIYFAHTRDGGANWSETKLFHDQYDRMKLNKGIGSTVILSGPGGLLMSWDWETGFKEGGSTPSAYILPNTSRLVSVYPNPVVRDKGLSVKYTLSSQADVSLKVYDLRGRLVKQIFNGSRKAGSYTLVWDLRDENKTKLTQGVYVLKLKLGSKEENKRVVIIK